MYIVCIYTYIYTYIHSLYKLYTLYYIYIYIHILIYTHSMPQNGVAILAAILAAMHRPLGNRLAMIKALRQLKLRVELKGFRV